MFSETLLLDSMINRLVRYNIILFKPVMKVKNINMIKFQSYRRPPLSKTASFI